MPESPFPGGAWISRRRLHSRTQRRESRPSPPSRGGGGGGGEPRPGTAPLHTPPTAPRAPPAAPNLSAARPVQLPPPQPRRLGERGERGAEGEARSPPRGRPRRLPVSRPPRPLPAGRRRGPRRPQRSQTPPPRGHSLVGAAPSAPLAGPPRCRASCLPRTSGRVTGHFRPRASAPSRARPWKACGARLRHAVRRGAVHAGARSSRQGRCRPAMLGAARGRCSGGVARAAVPAPGLAGAEVSEGPPSLAAGKVPTSLRARPNRAGVRSRSRPPPPPGCAHERSAAGIRPGNPHRPPDRAAASPGGGRRRQPAGGAVESAGPFLPAEPKRGALGRRGLPPAARRRALPSPVPRRCGPRPDMLLPLLRAAGCRRAAAPASAAAAWLRGAAHRGFPVACRRRAALPAAAGAQQVVWGVRGRGPAPREELPGGGGRPSWDWRLFSCEKCEPQAGTEVPPPPRPGHT